MISVNNPATYSIALRELKAAAGHGYLGRLAQIFLACKHYGKAIPQVGDPVGMRTGELEEALDGLFLKPSPDGLGRVVMLFNDEHRVPSGKTADDLTYPSNIWRNNLGLQKGYMCFATPAEFADDQFRNQSRKQCPHLIPENPGTLAGARCALDGNAKYRGDDHPKMFRKDTETDTFFVYNPQDIEFYRSIVLASDGTRLPIRALIIAIYHASQLAAERAEISIEDFAKDFDLSPLELNAYFHDDPNAPAHQALIEQGGEEEWASTLLAEEGAPAEEGAGEGDADEAQGTVTAPPAGGFWWDAEQAVRKALEEQGWSVVDVSRVGVGYDLRATRQEDRRMVEVKSSIGGCAPVLTELEFETARSAKNKYVLAIVENFDPEKDAHIQWVKNPASLAVTPKNVRQYYLPRSVWSSRAATAFDH